MTESTKNTNGDPLLAAMLKEWDERMRQESKEDPDWSKEDPMFLDLMVHTPSTALPLHNYYSEFRLGQGDPLLEAAMKTWPYTTTPVESREDAVKLLRSCTTVSVAAPSTLSDPSSGHLYWSSNDILHVENVGHIDNKSGIEKPPPPSHDRRFILMSDDRRFVLVP